MKTGQDACELGLYVSDCCDCEMIFAAGDCFCRCPECERLCAWDLLEPVVSWDETGELEREAA